MPEEKVKYTKPSMRSLTKTQVFAILDSDRSARITAKRFGVSSATVNMIRAGKRYKDFYREYKSAKRGIIASHLETLPFVKSLSAYYWWFGNHHILRIAFDDLLVEVNLKTKKMVNIGFNVKEIKGERLEYDEVLIKLDEYGYITL